MVLQTVPSADSSATCRAIEPDLYSVRSHPFRHLGQGPRHDAGSTASAAFSLIELGRLCSDESEQGCSTSSEHKRPSRHERKRSSHREQISCCHRLTGESVHLRTRRRIDRL